MKNNSFSFYFNRTTKNKLSKIMLQQNLIKLYSFTITFKIATIHIRKLLRLHPSNPKIAERPVCYKWKENM